MNAKKYALAGIVVVLIVLYVIFSNRHSTPVAITTTTTATSTTTSSTTAAAEYNDGTYTGPVADAIYGQLQVVAVIQNGAITDVQWPVYPDAPGHTTQVNQAALPALKQEAIQAQSAAVNIVSGATQTSEAFQQSLAAALAQAEPSAKS